MTISMLILITHWSSKMFTTESNIVRLLRRVIKSYLLIFFAYSQLKLVLALL